jgi:hypothetical protein
VRFAAVFRDTMQIAGGDKTNNCHKTLLTSQQWRDFTVALHKLNCWQGNFAGFRHK